MSDTPVDPAIFENTEVAFALKSNAQLRKSYRIFQLLSSPVLTDLGTHLTQIAFKLHLPVEWIVKKLIYEQFCGGETLNDVKPLIKKLAAFKIKSALDCALEGKSDEKEFERVFHKRLETIRFAADNPDVTVVSLKLTGIGHASIFEKIQSGQPLTEDEQSSFQRTKERTDALCRAAAESRIILFIDAEESWIQDPIDMIADDMMEKYNRQQVVVMHCYQLYRKDRLAFLRKSHQRARERGYMLGAKIVRGAYVEQEHERAWKYNYPSPVHNSKEAVDRDYNLAIDYCLENLDTISLCVATHNEESCLHAINVMAKNQIARDHPHVFFSQLYGMADHITFNLALHGYNATKYIPYGPVKEAIPYLIRRAQENKSVGGQMNRELQRIIKEMKRRGL